MKAKREVCKTCSNVDTHDVIHLFLPHHNLNSMKVYVKKNVMCSVMNVPNGVQKKRRLSRA